MTTLSQTDIANIALNRIGAQAIPNLTDQTNTSAIAVNTNWQLAFAQVARDHEWGCLKKTAVLAPVPQTPISPVGNPVGTTPWAPSTSYAANAYVTYGGQIYQALIANTSTASFINDLTSGFWFETDILNTDPFGACPGGNYSSGFANQYALPSDCLRVTSLNGNSCHRYKADWEIMGRFLYTNCSSATIQYVAAITDTTIYDSMFTTALSYMLASMIATTLRQDSGAISAQMSQFYQQALREARTTDGNEGEERRFSNVQNSRIIASRWGSTNN